MENITTTNQVRKNDRNMSRFKNSTIDQDNITMMSRLDIPKQIYCYNKNDIVK